MAVSQVSAPAAALALVALVPDFDLSALVVLALDSLALPVVHDFAGAALDLAASFPGFDLLDPVVLALDFLRPVVVRDSVEVVLVLVVLCLDFDFPVPRLVVVPCRYHVAGFLFLFPGRVFFYRSFLRFLN